MRHYFRYEPKCTLADVASGVIGGRSVVVGGGGGGDAADTGDPLAIRTGGVLVPPRLCRLCFTTVKRGTCFEELSLAAQRMTANPLEFLE